MCYRTSNRLPVPDMEKRYGIERDPELDIEDTDFVDYNINGFSHPPMLIIGMDAGLDIGPRPEVLHPALWGIAPSNTKGSINDYYRGIKYHGSELNARSEKAFDYWLYKASIMEKRCIVPVTGFFEPHKHKGVSYPFYFEKKSREHLSVAGLYSVTETGYVTFTLLTKEASPLFAKVHNKTGDKRQIVLLNEETEKDWLDPNLKEADIKAFFGDYYDEKKLTTYPVSRAVQGRKNILDGEEAVERDDYEQLETLEAELKKFL
ncbi:SOS response-associated peptidase [Leeuwenhoekiella parthenopeia]|uniref:Abasic site processing protein n=1 Tax=Leeuwenhoekiella parthenopeia TaxID=2890320 RepID=A0ABS8GNI3_9FLAO|nr:SOS response-associated peptidase family protein [Leeuwenhoekiella parthenopeia]MCC4211331.1 SOS response-associated peptidase [Leeuwenhoekiella parthenopeia]